MFYLVFGTETTASVNEFRGGAIATFFIYIAFALTMYALRSVGIFTLAKRKKIKNPWIAFIPAVWIFTACKIIGSVRFFGKPFKDIALAIAIVFSVCEGLSFIYDVLSYYPLVLRVFGNRGDVYWVLGDSQFAYQNSLVEYPYLVGFYVNDLTLTYKAWIENVMAVVYYINYFLSIISIVITVSVYFAIFKIYWPEHFVLASLLSVFFPLFGVFVFAIRKKKAVNYADYVRSRYQGYYPPNAQGRARPNNQDDEPFSELNGQNKRENKGNEDPFSDFFDNKDKK